MKQASLIKTKVKTKNFTFLHQFKAVMSLKDYVREKFSMIIMSNKVVKLCTNYIFKCKPRLAFEFTPRESACVLTQARVSHVLSYISLCSVSIYFIDSLTYLLLVFAVTVQSGSPQSSRYYFGSAYTKIGTIQRRLAWPLRKDDTHNS